MAKNGMSRAQLLRELHGAWKLYCGGEEKECRPAARRPADEVIVFVGGIGSHPVLYQNWAESIESRTGFSVIFPQVGDRYLGLNLLSLNDSLELLQEGIHAIYAQGRKIMALAGHSLGGIQAVAVARSWPLIPLVVAVGSPIWGTPFEPLQRFAGYRLGFDPSDPPAHFREMRERLSEEGERIVTISTPHDPIAPPESCFIPGVTNHVLGTKAMRSIYPVLHRKTVHTDCLTHDSFPVVIRHHLGLDEVRARAA